MPDKVEYCTYFEKTGPENTHRAVTLARERAESLGVKSVVVASTTGNTGAQAAELFQGYNLVVVTHSAGFAGANEQELMPENRARIERLGGRVLTCQHALGGVNRAVRRKLATYELDEVVAFVLRNFCDGLKVACEITLMAADAGLVPAGEEIIAIGGTGKGADTAAVILSANAQDFFNLRVLEIICKPRVAGRPKA